jgi:2,3-bisphosphoglycerate-dependent phosphoglycerate mutase
MKYLSDITSINIDEIQAPGPKIAVLIEVHNLGINIPETFLITDTSYNSFITDNNLASKIADLITTVHYERADSVMQVAAHIKKLVQNSELPEPFRDQIDEIFKKHSKLFKKTLFLVDEKLKADDSGEMIRNIKKVWAKNFEPQNIVDNKKKNSNWILHSKPILIQKIINSSKKGKMLTTKLEIETDRSIDKKTAEKLIKIREKIKKSLFVPYEISWVIEKNEIYIVDLKPMTNLHKAHLVLIRHGRSEYNEKGLWAGWDDPQLTKNGIEDVRTAAKTLTDIHLDLGYTSRLIRHKQTLDVLRETLNRRDLPVIADDALLERNYGDFTAKNKWEVEKQIGKSEFLKLRRSWDYPVPNGESLKDVYERVVPYYEKIILKKIMSGKNVVIASSGNCLRALVKHLDNISDNDISSLEIATGEVYVYTIDEDGKVVGKEIRNKHENKV